MTEILESNFPSTLWTMILNPGEPHPHDVDKILVKLCESYRPPVLKYIRRKTGDADNAEDLTQSFFEFLITKKLYRNADRDRGKFRTFLLAAVKNFLRNEYRNMNREKRGGGKVHVPIEMEPETIDNELRAESSAEEGFDIKWAQTLFDSVWVKIEEEYEEAGKLDRFLLLQASLLMSQDAVSYAELAPKLGMTEAAVKSAARRLRKRFHDSFKAAVSQLVDHPDEVDEEIAYLTTLLGRES